MDYVDWCDALAVGMAEFAEQQHGQWVHLHLFAAHVIASRQWPSRANVETAVILDAVEVLSATGLEHRSQEFRLTREHLASLRDHYGRWVRAQVPVDDPSLILLGTLNRMSQRVEVGYTTVDEVDLDVVVSEVGQGSEGVPIDTDDATELLDGLERRGLAHCRRFPESTRCKSSYLGIARTNRTHVATDQEIDRLRTEGEGDTLDYKRSYKLGTDAEKWEFTKDVTALVNAGGPGARPATRVE